MIDDTVLPSGFPAVGRKKVKAAFGNGRLTSNGGMMVLSPAEKRLGIAPDPGCGGATPRRVPLDGGPYVGAEAGIDNRIGRHGGAAPPVRYGIVEAEVGIVAFGDGAKGRSDGSAARRQEAAPTRTRTLSIGIELVVWLDTLVGKIHARRAEVPDENAIPSANHNLECQGTPSSRRSLRGAAFRDVG